MLGVMRQNPQQAAMNLLQQGLNSGRINQQQYNAVVSGIQNGDHQPVSKRRIQGVFGNRQQYPSIHDQILAQAL